MRGVGRCEAKNALGQLLDLVGRGEEIMIARHGKAVGRLVPYWIKTTIPAEIRSYEDLERIVPRAAEAAGLDAEKP
jgi:antitoxin (DNA-binding transcriptional repressor) of toxin-antitoxin stability system